MITYNHERFLSRAIDSALAQRLSSPFEIVVGDDCSTDNTSAILASYLRRFPDIVRSAGGRSNVGVTANLVQTLSACRGKYVALLEGDDFWTDPQKLQIQLDYMEGHAGCVVSFHAVMTIAEDGSRRPGSLGRHRWRRNFGLMDVLARGNLGATCSIVLRRTSLPEFPPWYTEGSIGDFPLQVLLARSGGTLHYSDRIMGAYQLHTGGVFSAQSNRYRVPEVVRIYDHLDRELDFRYHRVIESMQSYWRAVESARVGDDILCRRLAGMRLFGPPISRQSLKALVMLASPNVYRAISRNRLLS